MIRRSLATDGDDEIFKQLEFTQGSLLVATVSGTTMFKENRERLLQQYLDMFEELRTKYPSMKMVLLGRSDIGSVPNGVITIPYLANWIPLIKRCNLLLAHPGWITVTEVSVFRVPAIFVLSSYREYHEIEAIQRLQALGYQTHIGLDFRELARRADCLLSDKDATKDLLSNYKKVAPNMDGASCAAKIILSL